MRRVLFLAVPLFWLGAVPSTKHRTVEIQVEKKTYRYYVLVRKAKIFLPAGNRMRFLFRCFSPSHSSLSLSVKHKEAEKLDLSCAPSKRARFGRKRIGKKNIVALGPFSEGVELQIENASNQKVLFRILSFREKKDTFITYHPEKYERSVELISQERLWLYFYARKGKPISFTLIGPTELVVLSRIVYDKRIRGKQKYRVLVQIGKEKKMYRFTTNKSQVSRIKGVNYWIPSVGKKIYVSVPEGKQKVRVQCLDTLSKGCLFRFAILKKSINNK